MYEQFFITDVTQFISHYTITRYTSDNIFSFITCAQAMPARGIEHSVYNGFLFKSHKNIKLNYYNYLSCMTCVLLQCMQEHRVYNMVFSSSATVYGDPKFLPITEEHPAGDGITNPYGKTKYFIEEMLKDLCLSDKVRARLNHCMSGNKQTISITVHLLKHFKPLHGYDYCMVTIQLQ